MTKTSALHDVNLKLGAKFTEFGGWSMPLHFDSVVSEHMAVRQQAGWFDVSHLGRFGISGPNAAAVLSAETTINPDTLEPGQTRYGLVLTTTGGIADDIVVWRLAASEFIILPNAANSDFVIDRFHAANPVDMRESSVMVAVQGPSAPSLLATLNGFTGPRFSVERFGETLVAGTGYTGERGGEVIASHERGIELAEQLMASGAAPCGLGARDTLRLEAGLPLWGQDMDASVSPYRAGLGFAVDLGHDFVGKDALDPDERSQRVLFTTGTRRIPRAHQTLIDSVGNPVGEVTSGSFSPIRETGIGMGRLHTPSDTLAVDIRGTATPVERVKRNFL